MRSAAHRSQIELKRDAALRRLELIVMQIEQVIKAWNAQADENNQWAALDADERVDFALRHIEREARQALDDLEVSVYTPENSAISVAHALDHVRQVFSA